MYICEACTGLYRPVQACTRHPWFADERGVLSDLDEAIDLYRAALALHPPGHSDRSMSLNNLAVSLSDRFKQQGVLSDLDEAIDLYRAALALHPPGHSDQSTSLNNLASSLQDRFQQQGVLSDLDETFTLYAQLSQISHAVMHRTPLIRQRTFP